MCKEPLVCTLLVCYTEVRRAYQEESMDTENIRSKINQRKISKERLLMPPSAESCPAGPLQVCVGNRQAERRGIQALSSLSKRHVQGANFSELETQNKGLWSNSTPVFPCYLFVEESLHSLQTGPAVFALCLLCFIY